MPMTFIVRIFIISRSLTLRISAGGAVEAALLEDEHITALGALAGQVLGQAVVLQLGCIIIADVLLQDAGDGISAGKDGLSFFPGKGRAADTAQLLDHGGNLYPGS